MADKMTIEVVTISSDTGSTKTITLPNPQDELTLEQVQTAFATGFNNKLFIASDGSVLTNVKSATIIETTQTVLTSS